MPDFPTVLYVEDDGLSRKVMSMLLQYQLGLQHVTIFEDSQDFLARALALHPRPDVILLDIHVRPHDGFTMLEAFRAEPAFAQLPIVALTASVMNEEVEHLRHAGFNGCLGKPIDSDSFPELLQHILAGEEIWHVL